MTEDELKSFTAGLSGFDAWSDSDKVRLFAWLQHFLLRRDRFGTKDVTACYEALHFSPGNTSQYLKRMEGKELLKDGRGYYCEGKFRTKYESLYGTHDITLNVRQKVRDLINQVPDVSEKDFMKEAEICLRHDAGRATIIMIWNVAFFHLCQFILRHHLAAFNEGFQTHYNRKWQHAKVQEIRNYDDFSADLKESKVIEICKRKQIISEGIAKILVEKLGRRNSAAHPSTIHISQVQAEAFIDDLITNVVIALSI